ncbi:MAG: type II toxin-antitoxin system HicA family toxin [Candidatus Methanoperedens sp.]|nr:type II toxin-antitoxin system HicA family toxin [Candidatus Methanoperedens sp.]MCZ7361046.1 type II toxin-antitoxin system HicA family toxin [Candidatus Methanoperedens sp.]HLB71419.1 type II toxin-antitoxin system HicA family toxin [Candidatus Methanoperedens sp.]
MKLPSISGKEVIKTLKKAGFVVVRQRGSHVRLEKASDGDVIKVTVPLHTPLKKGTLCRIVKDAGFTTDEFIDLL